MRSFGMVCIALLLTACDSLFGSDDFESSMQVSYDAAAPLASAAGLSVMVTSDGFQRTVLGKDFSVDASLARSATFSIPAPSRLDVAILLLSHTDTVVTGSVVVDVQTDYRYGLTVYAGRGNPRDFPWVICVPAVYSLPVMSRPQAFPEDSVYVVWGGLPKGAVC